ncbi:MAG TPA: acetolactate synthase large subunit [Acidimicrobiales bacterium]|nr:acetolactate synthase large subunit [Acidimicrobiales bacterium]
MNGAHALLSTMGANDVTVCFANPGTSEMHFVAGLDETDAVRGILCLFEGVATGAADGYARVSGRPAATLLHLGPGLANGWANLHNARRARVPLLNIVGDHATYHAQYDAPLQSDVAAVAGALEGWVGRATHANTIANDTADAITAAWGPPGQVATLVLPADTSWGPVEQPPGRWPLAERRAPHDADPAVTAHALERLRAGRAALFVGGAAVNAEGLALAQRVARSCDARVIMETFPAVVERGAGRANPERLVYLSEFAVSQLADLDTLVLLGTTAPVGFFAYPDLPSVLVPEACEVVDLAPPGYDAVGVLRHLASELRAPEFVADKGDVPAVPDGALDGGRFAAAVASTLPEDVVVVDESNTGGLHLFGATRFAPPHRLLTLTGGSIGFGLPNAVGAAVAHRGRVLALESDGSAMYTFQALWTMAREQLDVTVVVLANRSYAILHLERERVGAVAAGARSRRLLDLDDPVLDFVALAESLSVPACRVSTAEDLVTALRRSYATPGPSLIEARMPAGLT